MTRRMLIFMFMFGASALHGNKMVYQFSRDPIDVVIPCARKDVRTINLCIEGVRRHVKGVRRIIVVASQRYTDQAEWFDERLYPFNKYDIAYAILGDEARARAFIAEPNSRIGWIYQQLLKLYAPYVIPQISSNVLIVDADTIFLKSVSFIGEGGAGLYNAGSEYRASYFEHMDRLLPSLKRVYKSYSGICHHMLFQRSVLDHLFRTIETYQRKPLWQALCCCIDQAELRAAPFSEYEIYFNFAFSSTEQLRLRMLRWANIYHLDDIARYKKRRI